MAGKTAVPLGKTFKRCSCRGENGRELGSSCPKLTSRRHGTWCYRIELPAGADGARRPRRRSGFDDRDSAQDELDRVRTLLALPDVDDQQAIARVGDVIAKAISGRKPIPSVEEIRTLLRARVATLEFPTSVRTCWGGWRGRRGSNATPTAATSRT